MTKVTEQLHVVRNIRLSIEWSLIIKKKLII